MGYGTTVIADQSPVTGTTNTSVSKAISGLTPNTTYHYRVVGQNAGGTTHGTDISFTTLNTPPTANAGPDQTVDEGTTVTLDGSNSTDPDDGIASYQWTQTAGTPITFSDSTAAKPTFASPDVGPGGEALTFQLTVTDNGGLQDTDTCIVNVTWENEPPTADAGPDQTVDEGTTVTLDGSNSTDPDDGIASYQWTQTAGTSVTLSDATAAKPTFTSPDVGPGGEALTFQLTVTDNGGLQDTETCIVNVTWVNAPPTADAGPDQTVDEGTTVTLDGSNSTDPDDGIASYQWTQTAGTSVTLSDPTAAKPTFVTPPVDVIGIDLTFQLTVTDNGGLQASDEVTVTIDDNGITGFPDDVLALESSTGESIGIKIISGGNLVSLKIIDPQTIADTKNRPDDLIYGLLDMTIKTDTVGGTVTLTVYLPNPAPDYYTWCKYSPTNGWRDFSNNIVFNDTRDQVTITLTDGGAGDDDGVANGIIVDPSGLGFFPFEGGVGGGDDGCFIATAAYGSPIEQHVKILRDFRERFLLTNKVGDTFVRIYYKYSPPMAEFIGKHGILRTTVRWGLLPLVGVSWVTLNLGPVPGLILISLFGFVLISLTGFMRGFRKR